MEAEAMETEKQDEKQPYEFIFLGQQILRLDNQMDGLRQEIGKVETNLRQEIGKVEAKVEKVFIAVVVGFLLTIAASLLTG
jgi:cell division protein FtsL